MERIFRSKLICGTAVLSLPVLISSPLRAAVSLNFTDNDSTPTSTIVAPGATFAFSVILGETLATEQVSGVDYQIHASTNNTFEFLTRNSQVAGSLFTSPNGNSDAVLDASPVILNPNNGTDLGTSTASTLGAPGPNTYELSDFTFKVLSGTPIGVYTLSFVDTDTSGPPPAYATGSFNSLGTFTVTVAVPVPEPVSTGMLGVAVVFLARRPVKRRLLGRNLFGSSGV